MTPGEAIARLREMEAMLAMQAVVAAAEKLDAALTAQIGPVSMAVRVKHRELRAALAEVGR